MMRGPDKLLLALLIIGLADAVYLSLVQLGSAPLYCSTSGAIDCAAVESSAYSVILGIPLSLGILVWFVIAILLLHVGNRSRKARDIIDAWYVLGIGGSIYSLASMYALGKICEYCLLLDGILLAIGYLALRHAGIGRAPEGQHND